MAVPKRKTSKARRDKRRAQHGIAVPERQRVPELRFADARASRLPHLQDVPGPRHPAARNASTVSRRAPPGRRGRPRGRLYPGRDRRRRRRRRDGRDHARSSTGRPTSRRTASTTSSRARWSRWTTSLPRRCAASPTRRSSGPCAPSRDGEADAVVSAGNTGAVLAASLLHVRRLAGRLPPRDRDRDPHLARPVRPHRRRCERRRAPGASAPVRAHGLDLRRGGARHRVAAGPAPVDRRGAGEGEPADARRACAARGELASLRGKPRGARPARGRGGRRSSATASRATSP